MRFKDSHPPDNVINNYFRLSHFCTLKHNLVVLQYKQPRANLTGKSLSLHQPLLRYVTDGKRWGEEDSILCSFYKCPFTPYPVLYVVSLIHFTTTTPCDPQVAAHTQNFSVRLSERKRDTFSHTALFFSITPSLALDGKCTRGRG